MFLLRKGSKTANRQTSPRRKTSPRRNTSPGRKTSPRRKTSPGRNTSLKTNAPASVLPPRRNRMPLHPQYIPVSIREFTKNQNKKANVTRSLNTTKKINNPPLAQQSGKVKLSKRRIGLSQKLYNQDPNYLYKLKA